VSDIFNGAKCPDCKGKLNLDDHNYSGTGVDMGTCLKCGHAFEVSYKIDKIKRATWWEAHDEEEE